MGSSTKRTEQDVGAADAAPASSRARSSCALPIRSSPAGTTPSLRSKLTALKTPAKRAVPAPARAKKKTPPFARNPVLQELEPRLLMSADLNPALQDTVFASPALAGAEFRNIADHGTPTVVTSAAVAPIQRTNELVFVDTATPDYQQLIDEMLASALGQGRHLEFVLIDQERDGIRKITDTLAKKSGLDAIHIVSHAADGSVQLGSSKLDFETLLKRAAAVKKWGSALTENGDILFYGCDLAASEKGKSLLEAMSRLTRADVAASEDLTGSATKGGDWDLEFRTGSIESDLLVGEDVDDVWEGVLATITVTNANDSGAGSFRAAIITANASVGVPDTINFNIPGAGVHTINLLSALPTISDQVTIDATTEGGWTAGTPMIELNGAGAGAGAVGLTITASNSVVQGLVINRFSSHGIVIDGGDNNVVRQNFIGTNAAGNSTYAANFGNAEEGIQIRNGAANNLIGGVNAGNTVAGNDNGAIRITGGGSDANRVQGNWFGTNSAGDALGQGFGNVEIDNGASGNTIGGVNAGEGNVIAFADDDGMLVYSAGSQNNAILGNSIHSNDVDLAWDANRNGDGNGIDLNVAGDNVANHEATANDGGDADAGPNALQNHPTITSAMSDGASFVRLTVNFTPTQTLPNTRYRIEFFSNPGTDVNGYREGAVYLGFVNVTTDGAGAASVNVTLAANVPVGRYITATATRTNATFSQFFETSEFSQDDQQVVAAGGFGLSGILYHDVDGDADIGEAGTQRFAGASVRIFQDDGDGVLDGTGQDPLMGTAISDANGNWGFIGLAGGGTRYWVVANSKTLAAPGYNAGSDLGDVWAEQTYGIAAAVTSNAGTTLGATGAFFGGKNVAGSDNANAANTAEHVIGATIGAASIGNLNAGFSFNAVVNNRGDTTDDDTSFNRMQQGSLRQFIQNSNAIAGTQTANFSIGTGAVSIAVGTELPYITDTLIIDGTSQEGFAGTPLVELAGSVAEGLYLDTGSSGSTIKGLVLNGFQWAIDVVGSSNNVITGNFLGTNAAGTAADANWTGVWLGTSNNTVGGTTAADRNIISGNSVDGVQISGTAGGSGNVVIGNYIGLDVTGTVDLGNTNQGVAIYNGGKNNTIGGTAAGAGNVISGNNGEGVRLINAGTTGNVVLGNLIGTNAAGTAGIANTRQGVWIDNAAANNIIGGTAPGAANTIAYNTLDGVALSTTAGSGNRVTGNGIFSNGGLGIDLSDNGVTANDAGDADTGPNSLQNFPVLTGAYTDSGSTVAIAGSLNSTANGTFRVEFFASASADASGYGEGQRYLGFVDLYTDASGNASFVETYTANVAVGEVVTATATNLATGSTSEYSQARTTGGALVITTTNDVVDGNTSSVANLVASKGADGKISLREAIIATNNTIGLDSVFVPSGTYTLSIVGAAEELAATGDLDIRDLLILAGAGASTTTINGGGIDRVFSLINSSSAYVTGVTVSGGNVTGDAGAFYLNSGGQSLVLTHAVLSGNVAGGGAGLGGAIRNVNGSLTMYDVRVTGNTASAGGGVYNNDVAFITDSLVDNNSAVGNGGGIDTTGPGSALTLVNVTLSGNLAGNAGGGLRNGRSTVLQNVTITNNTALTGGGLGVGGGSPTTSIRNTIIAGNTQTGGGGPDVNGTIQSAGYNIVGNNLDSSGWVASDQQNVNPMLGALASNGGSTMTHSLQGGSPAINAGISTGAPLVDQRDYLRDAQVDIGAFEYNGASQAVYAISGRVSHDVNGDSSLAGDSGQSGVTVHLFRDGGDGVASGVDDSYVTFQTTDVNGDYTFNAIADATYWVVVDSKTFSANTALWAEQTRGSAGALGPSGYLAAAGALYGGRNAALSDNASNLPSDLDTAEHVTRVIVAGANVANVDSGFSFSAIVNARGDNTDDDGGATGRMQQGSLRQFILNSNAIAGVQTSNFSIGAAGSAQTIAPTAVLPVVTDAVVLDATTQEGFAGTPLIELNGAGSGGDGFNLAANGSTVRGFVINRFAASGIHVDGDNNTIVGNWIGLDASGTGAAGNGIDGVVLLNGAANNTIGGTGANDRNVISGNGDDGVSIDGAVGTVVIGNYIGLNTAGTAAVGNGGDGVAIQFGAVGSVVGGTSAAERNVISGNGSNAANGLANVRIREVGTTGNTVLGNYLGTNWNGSVVLANARYGVLVSQDATGNTIGGTAPGAGNTIVGSTLDGIAVTDAGSGNRILGNSVHTNGGLGIDLADDNVTANDVGDADAGGNNRQNFPALASAFVSGGNVTISGSLNSTAGSTFRIEFFANAVPTPGADASGNGEGQRYLGFMNVVTDGAGNVTFTSPALAGVVAGEIISATATDLTTGDTSEFAANLAAVTPGSISGTLYHDVDGDADVAEAGTLTFAGATVRLYLDDSDGVIDAGDTLVTMTATNGAGLYSFTGLLNDTYYVVVDSKTLTANPNLWAEQTYGAAGAANNSAGTTFTGVAGALYGGRSATVSDDAAALATADHVTRIAVAGVAVANVDSGFSFNVVTNVRGDNADDDGAGTGRHSQGTLDQFIRNANAIAGPNAMRFVPAVATNDTDGLGNNWWQITLTSALPQITGADTAVDGTAYSAVDGVTIVNPNNAILGYVGAVGLGADATPGTGDEPTLAGLNGAELELVNANTLGAGLDVQADDATIQYLAIHGFNTGDWLNDGDIRVGAVDGAIIRYNILGTGSAAQSDPGAGARSATGINIANATGGTLQGNVIAYVENFGVRLSGSNGWTVQGNDLAFTGLVEDQLDGIDANDGTGNIVVTGNMFRSNRAIGFDSYAGAGGNTVTDNSFIANGQGGTETAGARLFGPGNTVTRNLFQGNFGPAIIVAGDDAPTAGTPSNDNLISRNSFSGNTLGIDLAGAFTDNNQGDGVSANDGTTNPGAGNLGVDFPVIASAITSGATTTVSGTAGTGVTQVEVYRATPGVREGVQYLGTAVVAGGNWSIGVTGLVVGDEVTAIGTDVTGNTSEFCGDVTVVPVNVAPTLNGANNLAAIVEDAAGNAGTLASALIAGQVTDPDVGALSGIAVTAVNNTNGIWEYSLNGGGSWNAIAPVSNASALLLASDAATRVRFVPGADWNGSVAGLTFRAWDQFTGTAGTKVDTSVNGGGSAFSAATATASVTVDPANDAPTRLGATVTLASVAEDTANPPGATVSSLFGAVFSDVIDQVAGGSSANNLAGIAITANAANGGTEGTWQWFNGALWVPTSTGVATNSALVLSASTLVRFLPVADYNGTPGGLTLRLIDDSAGAVASGATVDVTVSGGTTVYSSAANAVMLGTSVTPVNDAPVLDTTKAPALTNEAEDAPAPVGAVGTLVSSLVDFAVPTGQVDNIGDVDGGAILGIAITAADTANGSWFYSTNNGGTWNTLGAVASATARLLAADANTRLYFQPVADFNGSIAAALTFRAWDQTTGANGALADTTINGGTSAFSIATDTAALAVTALNDAPAGTNNTVITLEDTGYVFAAADFGFTDPADAPANALLAVTVTTLPGAGSLTLSGLAVVAGQSVSLANIAAGNLVFTPVANQNGAGYASFTFQVQDNGGVLNGGVDLDPTPNTMTINVTGVNDAPAGTSAAVTLAEDGFHVFTAANFGFSDPADVPANAFLAIRIASLPVLGTLTNNALPVNVGDFVSVGDITAGLFRYTPPANANGVAYASFDFQVQDNGGIALGGVDLDQTPNTITFDVTAVNDAPVNAVPVAQATNEDTALVFSTANANLVSIADLDAGAGLVDLTLTVTNGTLILAGTAGLAFQAGANGTATMTVRGTIADINTAMDGMSYAPIGNYNGAASLTILTDDRGLTGTPGPLIDTDVVNITVNSVNDAPAGTDGAVTLNEDATYTFAAADFGFTDPNDAPANAFFAVRIASLPGAGTLFHTVNGPVGIGTVVSVADITAGLLRYTPAADQNGAPYTAFTFQVQDDGGSLLGGIDLDASPNTVTLDVTAVNDAPVNTVPPAQATNEDTALVFSTANANLVSIADLDAGAGLVDVTLTVTNGTLTLAGTAGLAFQAGANGAATMTMRGTIADINTAMDGMSYAPTGNYNGAATLTILTDDRGLTGTPGPLTDTDVVNITVNAVNDAPVNAVPPAQATNEDTALVFSPGNGNQVLVADLDAGASLIDVTLTVTNGTLTLAGTAGLAFQAGANGTATMTVRGTLVDINAAMNGMTYQPVLNYTGAASLTIATDDRGFTGAGGALADNDTVAITVNPINDAPLNTVPGPQVANEDTPLTFSVAGGNVIAAADPDAATLRVTLSATNGVLTLASLAGLVFFTGDGAADATMTFAGSAAAINAALDGLSFLPSLNYNGPATVAITTEDLGQTGAGGPLQDADVVNVTVNALNDAPVIGVSGFAVNDGETVVIGTGALSATDVDDAATSLVFAVGAATNGHFELVSAPGVAITSFTQQQVLNGEVRFVHDGSNAAPAITLYVTDGVTNVGPFAMSVAFTGGGGLAITPPGGGGSSGGTPVVVPPPPLAPVTKAETSSPGERVADAFFRAPTSPPADGGDDGGAAEVAAPVVASAPGGAQVQKALAAETALPVGRSESESVEVKPLSSEIEVEPIRAEMQVLPMRRDTFDNPEDEERQTIEVIMSSVKITGLAFSVGAVWWAVRAAGLMASLLASSPAWRHVDPLPVLGRDDEEESEWDDASEEEKDRKDDEHRAAWVLEEREAS